MTDSLIIGEKFKIKHSNILRAIQKCRGELLLNSAYKLECHLIQSFYYAGVKGRQRLEPKYDISEFGLALLLLYINSPKARQIFAGQYLNYFMPFRIWRSHEFQSDEYLEKFKHVAISKKLFF